MPIGIVVVAVVVLATDTDADVGSGRSNRRRDRRRHRRSICRDIQRPLPPVQPAGAAHTSSPVPLPAPDERTLELALRRVEPELRACVPNARGLLILDAGISGERGAIRSFQLEGEGRGPETRGCFESILSRVRFDPFEGNLRVRWGINLSGESLPAPWHQDDSSAEQSE